MRFSAFLASTIVLALASFSTATLTERATIDVNALISLYKQNKEIEAQVQSLRKKQVRVQTQAYNDFGSSGSSGGGAQFYQLLHETWARYQVEEQDRVTPYLANVIHQFEQTEPGKWGGGQ